MINTMLGAVDCVELEAVPVFDLETLFWPACALRNCVSFKTEFICCSVVLHKQNSRHFILFSKYFYE